MDFSVMALSVICGLSIYLLILRPSNPRAIFDLLCTYSSLDHPIPDQFLAHFSLTLPWTIQFTRILLTLHVLSHTIVIYSRDFRGLLTNLLICRSFLTRISVGLSCIYFFPGHYTYSISWNNSANSPVRIIQSLRL